MEWPISQEKGPIGRKCEHWTSFLGIRNRLPNAPENPFPGGYGLSLLAKILLILLISRTRYLESIY